MKKRIAFKFNDNSLTSLLNSREAEVINLSNGRSIILPTKAKYILFNTVWDDLLQESFESDKEALEMAREYAKTQGDVMVWRLVATVKTERE